MRELAEAAAEAARLAGDVALKHFGGDLRVETKGDGTPVTIADRSAEEAARAFLERAFPEDSILGEEQGESRPGAPRKWIVDPIDGTKSFVRGVPLWGTLVAVAEGERVLAGAAYYPAAGERLQASRGGGCLWNGRPARVSKTARIEDAYVLATEPRFLVHPERGERLATLARRSAALRTWGDCYGYLLVATGRAEVMVDEVLSPWDAAALQVILEEAGGAFFDWTGKPTAFGQGGIGVNGALSADVSAALVDR